MGRQSDTKSVCNLGIKFQPMMFRDGWYNTAQALGSEKKHMSVIIVFLLFDMTSCCDLIQVFGNKPSNIVTVMGVHNIWLTTSALIPSFKVCVGTHPLPKAKNTP